MTNQDKIALKIACLRSAATLFADPNKHTIDPHQCAMIAKRLYDHVVRIEWDKPES